MKHAWLEIQRKERRARAWCGGSVYEIESTVHGISSHHHQMSAVNSESGGMHQLPLGQCHQLHMPSIASVLLVFQGDWCFQVCRDEVHKDQVPLADLPYLNATTCQWASHKFLHNPTAHDPPSTMTCPAVKLQDVARIGAPESDGQLG